VSDEVKQGDALFFGKAECNQCHLGHNFTDSNFHNLGIGWDDESKKFTDEGRFAISKKEEERGAFKTPGLRDVALHAPYMHDGSVATLRDVVLHYNKGGNPNPALDPKIRKLNLTDAEVNALVKMMEALTSSDPRETAPASYPR
jgi:cytochrome c peroxidase